LVASRGEVKVRRRERLYAELGERIRDVKQGPDGAIYLLVDGGNGRIVRIGAPDPFRQL
jgi:glucose/arabinose dehydrogenase